MDIGVLLKEHWQDLLDLRAEFMTYALTTQRADREKLEHAISGIYRFRGLEPPEEFFWFASPLDATGAASLWLHMLDSLQQSKYELLPLDPFLLSARWYHDLLPLANVEPPGYEGLLKALTGPMIITSGAIIPFGLTDLNKPLRPQLPDRRMILGEHSMFAGRALDIRENLSWAIKDTMHQQINGGNGEAWLRPWSIVRESLQYRAEDWQSLFESWGSFNGEERAKFLKDLITGLSSLTIPLFAHHSPINDAFRVAAWYALSIFNIDIADKMPPLLDAVKAGGWWWPFEHICFICDNPTELHMNEQMRLHSEDRMAIRFDDGWGFWALQGARVPEAVILNQFSIADIDAEQNSRLRALMIERFGVAKYVMETGALEIDHSDYGILYRKDQPPSPVLGPREPIIVVKVTNKTPEPDGSFRNYFLRVPPNISTAQEALAWSFSMEEREYSPDQES